MSYSLAALAATCPTFAGLPPFEKYVCGMLVTAPLEMPKSQVNDKSLRALEIRDFFLNHNEKVQLRENH